MTLTIAVQMDEISSIDFTWDSTASLMREAQNRNHRIFYFLPSWLFINNGVLHARGHYVTLLDHAPYYKLSEVEIEDFTNVDLLLVRQDPPFNMDYITATYLLEQLPKHVTVLNPLQALRNNPEKLSPLQFPKLIPATLITSNWDDIRSFLALHQNIFIKPLYMMGGRGTFKISHSDINSINIYETMLGLYGGPLVVQPYLPDIEKFEKRFIFIDGAMIGCYLRIPGAGELPNGRSMATKLGAYKPNARDIEICDAVSVYLKRQDIFFAIIDVIGDYLIEINITSPGGLVSFGTVQPLSAEKIFWDKIDEKFKAKAKG